MPDTGPAVSGDIVLETERLILRKITESDAALQDRVLNTPTVMQHLGGVKELHEIEERHAKTMASYSRNGLGFLFMIEKATGELVGHAGIKRTDIPSAPNLGDHEVGWLVREDRWRRGYAHEAMVAVLEWAFTRIEAPHVVAITSSRNVGSWSLMEKLGMERRTDLDFFEPDFSEDDNPVIQYSLTREAWESQQ
ncbi:MAG: GNAT family N-acetyltransferase [Pseudomonadota bacterium]